MKYAVIKLPSGSGQYDSTTAERVLMHYELHLTYFMHALPGEPVNMGNTNESYNNKQRPHVYEQKTAHFM